MTPQLESILVTDDYCIEAQNVVYIRSTNTVEFLLLSHSLLTEKQQKAISEKLACCIPAECKLSILIDYADTDSFLLDELERAKEVLSESACIAYPACAPLIDMLKWTHDEKGGVELVAPSRFLLLLSAPISHMVDKYGIGIPFKLRADEDMKYSVMPATLPTATAKKEKISESAGGYGLIMGKLISPSAKLTPISSLRKEIKNVTVRGRIVPMMEDEAKNPSDRVFSRVIADETSAVTIFMFTKTDDKKAIMPAVCAAEKAGLDLIVHGKAYLDTYSNEYRLLPYDICTCPPDLRTDDCEEKRVELHLHTKMSEMDGLTSTDGVIKLASKFGHRAIAITDHGVVHAFPNAMMTADKCKIKLLYGVEGYLSDDCVLAEVTDDLLDKNDYVSVSFVTMLGIGERYFVEISAYDMQSGEQFHTLVNAGIPIPKAFPYHYDREKIEAAPSQSDAAKALLEFIRGKTVVVHNADDYKLFCSFSARYSLEVDTRYVDTALMSHYLMPRIDSTDIDACLYSITHEKNDSGYERGELLYTDATAIKIKELFLLIIDEMKASDYTLPIMHGTTKLRSERRHSYYHIILLARNDVGKKNMYKLVTYSHLENFNGHPIIPKSLFSIRRKGLILGSACERGELFRAMLAGRDEDTLLKIASWYDYLEIQPIGNNAFMLRNGTAKSEEELQGYNRRILELGDKLGKMTVATGDVHFLNKQDAKYRAVIMHAEHFRDAEEQAPLYFRNTKEMLDEFSYLGEERAREVVITNTNAIADMCDPLTAYLNEQGTYAPIFDGANDELRGMAETRVHELYGEVLPEIVEHRLKFELDSIIGNGYATLYLMAQRLVRKSNSDGYLVGSRGSVGSSFVAYLAGITEVNPLASHYLCPNCKYCRFGNDDFPCGIDMEDAYCPECNEKLIKTGFDIPFEVFLGFKGDKTPDIDLNFSGEYQSVAHEYTREMFGSEHSFRAGVISTLKDKTVYGLVKKYDSDHGLGLTQAEVQELVMGCVGVKKTTGQHAGGMVIVPEGYEAEDFMPLQYAANDKKSSIITHFDFHAMNDKLVKLDILGHVDPTALRMLNDITGLSPQAIPLDDEKTLSLFSSVSALEINLEKLGGCDVGVLGIPEYGTTFVRKILMETRPTTIEELVRIAGLSHGTDVWTGNAQKLIQDKRATLSQVICTRDDIMLFLISKGCAPNLAFRTMESVRKGKGLTEEMEETMKKLPLPSWYIDSCKMIKYMFPRAHAVAYLTMAFRVAYYKMHYPKEFYAVYYTTRADDFDIFVCSGDAETVMRSIRKTESAIKDNTGGESIEKLKKLIPILEVVYEMNLRGITLHNIDINRSHASDYLVDGDGILPPFNSIAGLGTNKAIQIVEARNAAGGSFASVDDFKNATRLPAAIMQKLSKLGCFEGMVESEQLTLFDLQ